MISKLLVATALTLSLGGAAFAQSSTGTTTPTADQPAGATGSPMQMPSWDGAIGEAFFSDMNAGTLRSQDEIATNWSSLSADQQAQVKSDCSTMAAADSSGGATATDNATTSSTQNTTGTAAGGATSGAGASESDQMAAMSQLCGWVGSM